MSESEGRWTRSRDGPLYAALILGWLLLVTVSFAVVIHEGWERIEADFEAHAEREAIALQERLRGNEAVLDGFAAFLGSVDEPTDAQLRHFAERVLRAQPHIYMLEVVQRVEADDRPAFERALALRVGGDGRISRFDYAAGRSWGPVARKERYYPIAFIWPDSPEARPVLGLDIDSVPHLRETMHRAVRLGAPVSSPPFALVEGPTAYVMIAPARIEARSGGAAENQRVHPVAYALLVVKAESLRPEIVEAEVGHSVRALGVDGSPLLLDVPATVVPTRLERMLLPSIQAEKVDFSTSQPIGLRLSRQMYWDDLDAMALFAMSVLAGGSLVMVLMYIRQHRRLAHELHAAHAQALYGATHDDLTRLPNRGVLHERLEQAVARWRRTGERFSVFFIDLDRFKAVNDTYGHDAGDEVLRNVASRMQAAVRETDFVARIAGDEFVVLLSGTVERPALESVADKLVHAVAEPIELAPGVHVSVSASLGISQCPDDGESAEALLERADNAMYFYKRRAT